MWQNIMVIVYHTVPQHGLSTSPCRCI